MFVFDDPYTLITLIPSVISPIVAGWVWSRRPGRGGAAITILMLAVALWSVGFTIELVAVPLSLKHAGVVVAYLGIVTVPVGMLLFAMDYSGRGDWITRRRLLLLTIPASLTVLVVATNPLHHQFWASVTPNPGSHIATYVHGPLFWVHATYSYALLLIANVVLTQTFFRSPQLYRSQIAALAVAQLVPWLVNAIYIFRLSPLPAYVDLTPAAFTVSGVLIAWSVYRLRFTDIAPAAHYAVFNSLSDAVFIFDSQERLIDANPAALSSIGITAKQAIGQPAALIFANQHTLLRRYRSLEFVDNEFTIERNDEARIYQLRISPLYNNRGHLTGRTVLMHDITRLKQANRELEAARIKADESTQLKTAFLASVSHELRTPLSAIMGYTGLMQAGVMGDLNDDMETAINSIDNSSRYLLDLVNNILDLTRIEAGHVKIVMAPVDVREMVNDWQRKVAVLAEERNLDLSATVHPGVPQQLYADRVHLTQIAVNLLANAVKYTDAGSVSLSVAITDDEHWQIAVKDTGIGITQEAQAYIFDEFRQVESNTIQQRGGTGLGLAIVSKLTQQMGGRIWVESRLGDGSTFIVKLPRRVPEAEPALAASIEA